MLHQVEPGSADPVQLNVRGYTVDDADWSSRAQPVGQLQWRLRNSQAPIGSNLFEF